MLAFIKFQTRYAFSLHEFMRVIAEVLLEYVDIIEVLKLKADNLKLLKPDIGQLGLQLRF